MNQEDFWWGYEQGYQERQHKTGKDGKAPGLLLGKLLVYGITGAMQFAGWLIKGILKTMASIVRSFMDFLIGRY